MVAVKGLVGGKVQGVGFRYFVRQKAEAAALLGYVSNLQDGRVEFVLQGDAADIDTVLAEIRVGPRFASVDSLSYEDFGPDTDHSTFEIR